MSSSAAATPERSRSQGGHSKRYATANEAGNPLNCWDKSAILQKSRSAVAGPNEPEPCCILFHQQRPSPDHPAGVTSCRDPTSGRCAELARGIEREACGDAPEGVALDH